MKTTHYDSANEFDPVSYFEGKKVLLVGNSENPKEQDYLKYNSIVRMNLGVQEEPCDVWINNLVNKAHDFLGYVPNVEKIMRMNCEKGGKRLNRYPKELDKYKIWFWNVTDYNNLCNKYSYPRPTTGLIAIYYFLNFVNCDLTITGYDFFESRNRWTMEIHQHSGTPAYPVHDMEKEKQIVTDWVKQKNSMPLSNPQKEVIKSEKRFRVLITGRRFGKTHLCLVEILRQARHCDNGKIFYVSPTYRMSKEIMWKQLKKMVKELRWDKYINETELTVVLVNNCQISLKGADKSADNLRGVGLNFLVLDEFADIPEEAWTEVLRPTISDKHVNGKVLFVGTPKGFGNWSYDMFQRGQAGDPEWQSWKYTTIEGGQVEAHEIEQAKKDLDARSFRQEYEASFETYAGVVYYNFDRSKNVRPVQYDPNAVVHIGMDFNIDPMSACLFHVKQGVSTFFKEIVIYSSNTQEMIDEITRQYDPKKVIVYPDPASRQRKTSAGGKTDLMLLQNAGFNVKCKPTHALVRDRINSVNSRLCNYEGKRFIYIDPTCKNLINSLMKQLYKEGTNIPEKNGYDHMTDALGYAIEYLFPISSNLPPSQPKRFS